MFAILRHTRNGLCVALVGLIALSTVSPVLALQGSEFGAGDEVVVSEDVVLRTDVGSTATAAGEIDADTLVTVLEGTFSATDGSIWYLVSFWGVTGFLPASVLESPEAASIAETTENVEATAVSLPWKEPVDFAVAIDRVTCRADVSTEANEIVMVEAGQTVEITGEETWSEGIGWLPVNCAGEGGFIASEFVGTEAVEETAEVEVSFESTEEAAEVTVVPATEEVVDDDADGPPSAEEIIAEVDERANADDIIAEVDERANADAIIAAVNEQVGLSTETVTPEPTATATLENEIEDIAADTEVEDIADVVIDEVIGSDTAESVSTEETATVDETPVAETTEAAAVAETATEQATETAVVAPAATAAAEAPDAATIDIPVIGRAIQERDSTFPVTDDAILGTAEVRDAPGGSIACRTAPSADAPILTVMPEGMHVLVLEIPDATGWMSIVCGDQVGYAEVAYLWDGGNIGLDISAVLRSYAVIRGTGGGGVNCRSGASTSASVIGWFAEGSAVNVRGAAQGSWVPVVCSGQSGFVSASYLSAYTGVSGSNGNTGPNGNTGSNGSGTSGGSTVTGRATVANTGGAGLRCRTSANTSSSNITVVAEGTTVSIRGTAQNGWVPVVCAGQNGWMSGSYLNLGLGSLLPGTPSNPAPSTPAPSTPAPSGLVNGDNARVNSNLNLRYEPNTGAGVATYAPTGTVVQITGGSAGNGFYPVNWDGLRGYMHGDFLTKTSEAPSKRGGSGLPTLPDIDLGGGSTTATGNAIVDFAMGYVGYPYVWATHGPYSFDCSGFTSWVISNVVGKQIGYGLWSQVSAGAPVSRSNLQPGDIVFFQNTYKSGLSHVGIYIGGGQFVHAQNASTGVVVSDLNSSYYGSRWYGAVRIT